MLQKIHKADPLVCPSCQEEMHVIAFIEDQEVIRKILTHQGLWQIKARPRAVVHAALDLTYEPFNDWPATSAEDYLTDPVYPDEM